LQIVRVEGLILVTYITLSFIYLITSVA